MGRVKALKCKSQVLGVDLHPGAPLAAAGLVDGSLELWKYLEVGSREERLVGVVPAPGKLSGQEGSDSCRVVRFWNPAGESIGLKEALSEENRVNEECNIVAGYASGRASLYTSQGQELWSEEKAHSHPLSCARWVEKNVVMTGDEEGGIKVWDIRQNGVAMAAVKKQADYITELLYVKEKNSVLSTSGDGTLGVYNWKMGMSKCEVERISDEQDDDLLSMQVVRNGRKVIVGTLDGVLDVWSWGRWGDISDRFPGHPESISSLLKVDESTVCTGSGDGIVRIVSVFPYKLLGVIGDQQEDPIELLRWSYDRKLVASVSHDSRVRFHDSSILVDDDDEEEEEDDEKEDEEADVKKFDDGKRKSQKRPRTDKEQQDEEQEGEEEEDANSDSDSDSGSDSDEEKQKSEKRKGRKTSATISSVSVRQQKRRAAAKFFDDL